MSYLWEDELLLAPGPTPLPKEVRMAALEPMITHRSPAFVELAAEVQRGLQKLLSVSGPVVIFPGSGTAALEASIVNLLRPGDKALAAVMGVFGQIYADMAAAHGVQVRTVVVPEGEGVPIELLERELEKEPDTRALLVTHNETSTGVLTDLAAVGDLARAKGLLLLVDSVSGAGGAPIDVEGWGITALATASQKALMVPPGLAIVAFNEEGRRLLQEETMPRYYFDARPFIKGLPEGDVPYTPALSLWYQLAAALRLMEREGWTRVMERHERVARGVRAGLRALGLKILAAEELASPTVTAFYVPEGHTPQELLSELEERHGVVLARGLRQMASRVVRISHMGAVTEKSLRRALLALGEVLSRWGLPADGRLALEAAEKEWSQTTWVS
ncbi:MAG: alanine--glyoxylate aminotransferase family protein [Clostridiales bacterium]|nr:alanine--glyoxylate aminotransferase family protein [Clostridiales bacterium]